MNVLALETATSYCSVALSINGEQKQSDEHAPQKHAALLLPMVEQLLAESGLSRNQLDAIAFGQGPGSFTGLRIAAAAAQGIALGLDLPVVGVSTLAALAHQRFRVADTTHTIACLDARMSEVYWGFYETSRIGECDAVSEERVGAPAELLQLIANANREKGWEVAGDGAPLLLESEKSALAISDIHPEALDVLSLALPRVEKGDVVAAADALPVYLRNRVALTEAERAEAREQGN